MQSVLFVIGMHRSGTSAFAGSLILLGAGGPRFPIPAERGNPKGHFEPAPIVSENDRILKALGRKWHHARPISLQALFKAAPAPEKALGLLTENFGGAAHIVLKDPRLSLLLPAWLSAVEAAKALPCIALMLREPKDVAHSLARRDGFSPDRSFAIWLRYTLDAERHSRGYPRAVIRTGDFLADPVSTAKALSERFGLGLSVAAESKTRVQEFLDPSLLKTAPPVQSRLAPLAARVYAAMESLAQGRESQALPAELGALRREFDAIAPECDAAAESLPPSARRLRKGPRMFFRHLFGRQPGSAREGV
jgi:hypothetical protein